MSRLQNAMISLARNAVVSRIMRAAAARSALATRFVGGANADAAVATAARLFDRHGIRASLFYLGEYVVERSAIEINVSEALAAIDALASAGLDVHVSIDPTAIGFMESDAYGAANARRIARRAARHAARPGGRNLVMLDMEDLSILDRTCELHRLLCADGLPVAVTLQGRRLRTYDDLTRLVRQPTAVRLVKGAFPESASHDHRGSEAIDRGYDDAARLMLSRDARDAGFYPIFGTHDDRLASRIIECAARGGWAPEQFEFEMLYGVRTDWQLKLRRMGYQVRVYLPFGNDWWPYAVRRVGENPRNAWLLVRSLADGGYGID
ncbi:proline dehydrogenase family protein [Burkholderia sp. BDU5]|uniref:proline dehydrogenase family protein n=1 Tax=Burkholderia sp. BDU5 TaxID=1385590 RepID=UPI00075DFFF5|nr:proline dehydrogenase family protein [Burkholderia sp. BDU5]KVE40472.1 proline dehydrogenase [Burkholderia sp. BDU5]